MKLTDTTLNPLALIAAIGLVALAISLVDRSSAIAQATSKTGTVTNWRAKRAELEVPFGLELVSIAQWCQDHDLQDKVAQTLRLQQTRDPRRQYIFLPSEKSMPDPDEQSGNVKQWLTKVNECRTNHARRIFELAQQAAQADALAVAYQLAHEVIYYDRDHSLVRKLLGHQRQNTQWKVAPEKLRIRQSKQDHDFLPLARGEFTIAKTAHFEICSTATEDRTRALANDLERWHGVWHQVFYEYWGRRTTLKDAFSGKKSIRTPGRKFKVFFFRDKQDYVANLQNLVRGVAVSSGYYSNSHRVSFFYDGQQLDRQTWRHELTHQLFRESRGRSPENAFENSFIWLDEGVATYFESMTELDGLVTLGGFDAHRTQFARKQALLEGRALSIQQLNSLSQVDWQTRADANLYAQSSAVVDMLINDRGGRDQRNLLKLLQQMYRRPIDAAEFTQQLSESYESLDKRFAAYLAVDNSMVADHLLKPESRTFLCLPNAALQTAAFNRLATCTNLAELCLSQQTITGSQIASLKRCRALNRLILVGCVLESDALSSIANLPNLAELHLAYSKFSPDDLKSLKAKKPNLRTIQ